MKTVHHFELTTEVFLCEMFKHSSVNETFHEKTSVLWQTEAWQPFITDPFMVHLAECQVLVDTQTPQYYIHLYKLQDVPCLQSISWY